MDCTAEKKVCALHKVDGFPTLKVFRRGSVEEFNCPRDSQGAWTAGVYRSFHIITSFDCTFTYSRICISHRTINPLNFVISLICSNLIS